MGYAQGINAVMHVGFETTPGVTPSTGFHKVPLVSHSLGEERPLIEDDQLGFGRDGLDPVYDVATNDGDVVVPVDHRAFGLWLKLFFGAPFTTTVSTGRYQHAFTSGAGSLPSCSIEIGSPEVPSYSVNYGAMVNQIRIAMARSGMLNATLSMIAQGETDLMSTSVAGTPTTFVNNRFMQATGQIAIDGEVIGNIVSADISISNGLDKVEVIKADGRIDGAVPGVTMAQIRFTARFKSLDLHNKATSGTPVEITDLGWGEGLNGLRFRFPRVFLPRVKRPITTPRGIVQDFNCQASGKGGNKIFATLSNDVAAY
ncbi:phage tail tube protein [Sphingobium sp. B2]|uniref:phage tail tube protein n=1 Tax=Sphingobium sp. B2 TaxID=2583228 RepID=UPI0011A00EA0|nr:phage tail tube protein [Sphingobium sp. B2]